MKVKTDFFPELQQEDIGTIKEIIVKKEKENG